MSTDQSTGFTISEAATQLGISENAVRQRIKRETLPAIKIGGVWRVQLTDQPTNHQTDQPVTSRDHEADQSRNSSQSALVEQLQQENARLWAELEARREAEREQRIIISQLVGRVEALQAGYDMPHAPESDDRPGNEGGDDDNTEITDEPEQVADIWETTTRQHVAAWWGETEARTEAPDSMETNDQHEDDRRPDRPWWKFWRS
jgi:excisionase family DNA binding protein